MKHTPYDTGKVKIGLLYTPPPPDPTPEETWVQAVLLGARQGMTDEARTCVQSLVVIALVVLGILLLGGTTNA
jgi:hypothetical protein